MYQSNQARIKKENPSLLPGRGEGPTAGSLVPSQLSLSRSNPSNHNKPIQT